MGTGGGYSGFQVTERCEGFFGFQIHDYWICLGKKILAIIFSGSL